MKTKEQLESQLKDVQNELAKQTGVGGQKYLDEKNKLFDTHAEILKEIKDLDSKLIHTANQDWQDFLTAAAEPLP